MKIDKFAFMCFAPAFFCFALGFFCAKWNVNTGFYFFGVIFGYYVDEVIHFLIKRFRTFKDKRGKGEDDEQSN